MADETFDVGARVVAFLPNLRRFAIVLCRSRELADDLVQSACEKALLGGERFDPATRFDAWMFRILRNLWIDHLRRRRTAGPEDDIADHDGIVGVDGAAAIEGRSDLRQVAQAIGRLAEEQREVLLLVCVEDLSYKETAEVLSIPIGTVMSRLARARRQLIAETGINPAQARLPGGRGDET